MPGIWLGLDILISLIGLGFLGYMAVEGSESDAVAASNIVAGPLGLAWCGFFAAAIIHLFMKKAGKGVRIGVPIGCGCLGAIVFAAGLMVFYTAIWPSL